MVKSDMMVLTLIKLKKMILRRSLGIVLQDTHLFTGTIMENIRYGKLDATDDEVIAAAKLANADSFIRRLPKGYDTMINRRWWKLISGTTTVPCNCQSCSSKSTCTYFR